MTRHHRYRPPRKQAYPDGPKPSDRIIPEAIVVPQLSLLVKLGSIVIHADELTTHDYGPSPTATYIRQCQQADEGAIRFLLADHEVQEWLALMKIKGFLPLKRRIS